jgi:hypothetical protein
LEIAVSLHKKYKRALNPINRGLLFCPIRREEMAVDETPIVPPKPAVLVDGEAQEFLLYKITVLGATPLFTLADDRGRIIMTSKNIPPQMNYQRRWPTSPDDDPVPAESDHSMVGLMSLVTEYTYKVELHNADGSLKSVVIHSKYSRVEPFEDDDKFMRNLTVRVAM